MKGFVYLAGPYTSNDENVRIARFNLLTKKAADLMLQGYVVYSPITHGHTIAEKYKLPVDFDWWRKQCFEMLRHSSKLFILRLPGYQESIGVSEEITLALKLNIPIEYVDHES